METVIAYAMARRRHHWWDSQIRRQAFSLIPWLSRQRSPRQRTHTAKHFVTARSVERRIEMKTVLDYSPHLMPDRIPEISGATVVLVGSFNPTIFQPAWFAKQELLRQAEADSADIKVIIPQVTHFETERFALQVTNERFAISSKPSANQAPIADLVRGTFFVLEHTPVNAMGINHHMHFDMKSEEAWHKIGDTLAPKDIWRSVLEGRRPGLLSMTIQSEQEEPKGALFRVKVEPSTQIRFGIYFETNEHYPAPETQRLPGLMDILGRRWEESHNYASKIAEHILAGAGAPR